jgi:hypothetical protein
MVTNGALTLPTQPSHINLALANQVREGQISARPHPSVLNQGWFFKYSIDTHILGMPGIDQRLPILPSNDVLSDDGGWEFNGVPGGGRWFDPPLVGSYVYETDGLSNFTALILPTGIDADGQFTVTDDSGTTIVAAGALHTFSPPTSRFVVRGISPLVDGGNPLAFPTFLSFDQTTVSFTQTPVPEPTALTFAALAMVGVARMRHRRAALCAA